MTRNEKNELTIGIIILALIVALQMIDNRIGVVLLFAGSAIAFIFIFLGVPAILFPIDSCGNTFLLIWAIIVAIAVMLIGWRFIPISFTANVAVSTIGIISIPVIILW